MASKFIGDSIRHLSHHVKERGFNKHKNVIGCSLSIGNGTNGLIKTPTMSTLKWRKHTTNSVRYLNSRKYSTLNNNENEMNRSFNLKHANIENNNNITKGLDGRPNDFFDRVLSRFPGQNRCFSFAYGSGVFQQVGHNPPKGNMTDLIMAVNDPHKWHQENMQRNPSDYSGVMRALGEKWVTDMQTKWGARLYFNTLIPFEDGKIKYGVISRSDMVADLLDWDSMYPAGRLQKPVKILEKPTKQEDPDLRLALSLNLAASLHTALLLLPDRFSEERLYSTIAGLSYAGDFRMFVGGEDRNKVSNIVQGNMSQFRALYSKNLQYMSQFVSIGQDWSEIEQDVSPAGRHHHLALLPKNVQGKLVSVWNEDGRYRDVEDVLRAAAFERESGDIVNTVLERIVWAPSITQAIKGIITAGISKSAIYALSKLKKGLKSYGLPGRKTST